MLYLRNIAARFAMTYAMEIPTMVVFLQAEIVAITQGEWQPRPHRQKSHLSWWTDT